MKNLVALLCLLLVCLSSCQKEATPKAVALSNTLTANASFVSKSLFNAADSVSSWFGSYAGYYGPYPFISDSVLIKNGVAKDPILNYPPFTFSNVSYSIPAAYTFSGDSIIFEAVAKIPRLTGFSGQDMVLQLFGEQDSAEVHFIGVPSKIQYTQFYVGNIKYTQIPALVKSFEDYKTIKLVLRNNSAGVFVNNNFIFGFKYGKANMLGKLKRINVAGNGYVVVDNVRLLNSNTQKLILSEDFNKDGKSNTIFY